MDHLETGCRNLLFFKGLPRFQLRNSLLRLLKATQVKRRQVMQAKPNNL